MAVHLVVRVLLPDRPGALGAVAQRIASVQGDIVGVDVLERSGSVAVDEFFIDVHDADVVPLLIREIEAVDGAAVEEARPVDAHPEPLLDALASAEALVRATDRETLWSSLVDLVAQEFTAEWVALVTHRDILRTAGPVPSADQVLALNAGVSASPLVASGAAGPSDLLVAPLDATRATLLVSRSGRPFRQIERGQCCGLARIADGLAQRFSNSTHNSGAEA
ncbi:MAG: ACT domain-containing protein [Acidimicrobiia bacterium]